MKLLEIMRRPSPAATGATGLVGLELEHPDFTGNEEDLFAEFQVQVEFTISPDDASVGWRGGADELQSITIDENFKFMGRQYREGQALPRYLLQYWSPVEGYRDVEEFLLSKAEEDAGDSMSDGPDEDYDDYRNEDRDYY